MGAKVITRLLIYLALMIGSILLVSGSYSFPTYAAGGILGVGIFLAVFPYFFVLYLFVKKMFGKYDSSNYFESKPGAFIGFWYRLLLLGPNRKQK